MPDGDTRSSRAAAPRTSPRSASTSRCRDRPCYRRGVLGLDETPITWERLLGVGLLLAGTYLIVC